jgi:hypothetical protein
MNRQERRVAARQRRSAAGKLKLRCIGCERVGKTMTKEHVWPRWLTERAEIRAEGVRWGDGRLVAPSSATLPLCADCNHAFGAELEEPVSRIFEEMERGAGISDPDAEMLVRWLWKFEGLFWNAAYFTHPELRYSDRWTLKERILGPSMTEIRPALVLAAALIEKNDEGHTDWPVGLDSPITDFNSIFVAGVFCRTAIMVLLDRFVHLVPQRFGTYRLAASRGSADEKVLFPPAGFETCRDAIAETFAVAEALAREHEAFSREEHERSRLLVPNWRIEIP